MYIYKIAIFSILLSRAKLVIILLCVCANFDFWDIRSFMLKMFVCLFVWPPILFSTDFDGFFYWDECSQKWCNSLLISSQFSTMNCIIINWSWLNSLLIIIKYSTIHWENALFSTESIRILYWFWRDSLLIWGTFSTVRLN